MSSEMPTHSFTEAPTQHPQPDSKSINIQLRRHKTDTLENALRVEEKAKETLSFPQLVVDKVQEQFVNLYIRRLSPKSQHLNREDLPSIIKELKAIESHLATESLYPGIVNEETLSKIVSYGQIIDFCHPYFSETSEKLKELRQISLNIIETANMGLSHLSDGTICILKITAQGKNNPRLCRHGHSSLLIDNRKFHMTLYGLQNDPPNTYDPSKFQYLELDVISLTTNEGMKALKETLEISDPRGLVQEMFLSVVKTLKEEYTDKNISFKNNIFEMSQSLFYKQNQDQLIREHQPMNETQREMCSTFVAKFIEEAVLRVNNALQKRYITHLVHHHPEKLQDINGRIEAHGLRFVNSPFPSTWNLDKITPADLVTEFSALRRSKAHWGKFAPFVQD